MDNKMKISIHSNKREDLWKITNLVKLLAKAPMLL
jgi:hypothetical protein